MKHKRAVDLRKERGREIWVSIFVETLDPRFGDKILPRTYNRDPDFPLHNATNSTDYFLRFYYRMKPQKLTAENNEWCIVANSTLDAFYSNVPVLFTRNLNVSNLSDSVTNALTDEPPFGKRGVVIITHGGFASFLNQEELIEYWKTFSATNEVFRP